MAEHKPGSMFHGIKGFRILSILAGFASIAIVDFALFASVNGQYKYRLYRIHFGVVLQVVLFFMSRFIWRRSIVLVTRNRFLQTVWRTFLASFIALSHLGPFFTFINYKEPTTLGCIAWICCAAELLHFGLLKFIDLTIFVLDLAKFGESKAGSSCKSYSCRWLCIITTILYVSVGYFNAISPPLVLRWVVLLFAYVPYAGLILGFLNHFCLVFLLLIQKVWFTPIILVVPCQEN